MTVMVQHCQMVCNNCMPTCGCHPFHPLLCQDASLSVEERVEALLKRLTDKQKVDQLQSRPANGIKELGVPAFNWQARGWVGGMGDSELAALGGALAPRHHHHPQ